jgi:hypothetical protein
MPSLLKQTHRLLVTGGALLLAACTTATPTIQTGPDAEVTYDGLHEVENNQADEAWARPGIDLAAYTKIMLQGAGIEYAPADNTGRTSVALSKGGSYFIDDDARASFEKLVGEIFVEEMSKIERFTIVDEPGTDVLLVRGAMKDVVSYVPPDFNTARSKVYLSSVGEATLVLELRDSITGAVLARSIDRRAAERMTGDFVESNRVTNTSEVRRLIRFWARRLRENLDGFGQG